MRLVLFLLISTVPALAGPLPPGFVRLADVAPDIRQDMRYAGTDNFTGRVVPGYGAPSCWLRREVAEALGRAAADLAKDGWRVVVHDCYRPKRAVAAFARWAEDIADVARKADYYPDIDKRKLFALGYIARASSHSSGTAIDLAAETLDGQSVDFGTPFDFFSPKSGTGGAISGEAKANRGRLAAAMGRHGLANYAREWWHFSLAGVAGATARDEPIVP